LNKIPIRYSDSNCGTFLSDLSKSKFTFLIKSIIINVSAQWIKDRISKTANNYEVSLIKKYPNHLIRISDKHREPKTLIAVYNNKGEQIELTNRE
jgi:hypothetical protein